MTEVKAMTSYALRQHLSDILAVLSIDHAITKFIFILSRGHDQISAELTELLHMKNRTLFSKKQQSSMEKFEELRKQSETFPLGQIFHEAIQLQNTLIQKEEIFGEAQDKSLRELRFQLERFYKSFEMFARNGNDQTFASLMVESAHLYTMMAALRKAFSTMEQVLLTDEGESPTRMRITMCFEHTRTIRPIVEKLGALDRCYQQICNLTGISLQAFPLELIKLEACALYVCVEGERRAAGILSSVVERFVQFIYGRFASGEVQTPIADRVVSTQTLVTLSDELERAGFHQVLQDTARLQKAALNVRRDLAYLLLDEPAISINEREYVVDESVRARYLEESRQLQVNRSAAPPQRNRVPGAPASAAV